MPKPRVQIEVHYTAEFSEKDFARVLEAAKESGCGYGDDPGPKEIVRRFLMTEGLDGAEEVMHDSLSYARLDKPSPG